MSLGENIRYYRKQKNLTQKQLADLIGAKHNSVSDWELNKNKPDPDTIELICGVLDIEPNQLLSSSTTFTTIAAHRTDGYEDELPEEAKEELRTFIEYLKVKYRKKD